MSTASVNVYRSSWLAWPTRLLCWPLAVLYYVVVLAVRLLGVIAFAVKGESDEGIRRLKGAAARGFQYLTFQDDELPSITGRVRAEGETPGPWWEAKRRLKKSHVAMVSVIIFVCYVYVGVAAQAGWVADDYREGLKNAEFAKPGETKNERYYSLGSDQLGRDILKLTVRGTTTALWIGLFAATLSSLIGMVLGALAGYFGGWVDDVIVWAYTTLSAIPYLLLVMAASFVFKNNPAFSEWYNGVESGPNAQPPFFLKETWSVSLGLFTIILVIGLTSWVSTCRIVRAEMIKHRDRDYVLAARAMGLRTRRVIFRHMLPNVFHLVLITFSLLFITAIKFEVILSFLGLGLEPEEASWGNMISKGAGELLRADTVWWQITVATVALFGLVLAVNLFADALRDALDPRLRK